MSPSFRLRGCWVGLLASALLLVGCGAPAATPKAPAPAAPAAPAKTEAAAPAKPAATAPAPAPAAPVSKTKLVVGQPFLVPALSESFIARELGMFEKRGLELDVKTLGGGGKEVLALVSGDAQFAFTNADAVFRARSQGHNVSCLSNMFDRQNFDIVVRTDVADRLKIDFSAPVDKKLSYLKNLTIGVSSPGGLGDNIARYYLTRVGLKPEVDTKLVVVGGGGGTSAALMNNQIDGAFHWAPFTQVDEATGKIKILVNGTAGEDPLFQNKFTQQCLGVATDYAKKNPNLAKGMVAALTEAAQWYKGHSNKEVADVVAKYWDIKDPKLVERLVGEFRTGFPVDGRITEAQAKLVNDVLIAGNALKAPIPYSEGIDNSYH